MNSELSAGIVYAFWLGILTSISPCPLATNLAAVSYIGQRIDSQKRVLLAGALYTAGRAATYTILGYVIVKSMSSLPLLSHFLQKYMNIVLGPVLVVVGMILLDLISLGSGWGIRAEKVKGPVDRAGIWGAGMLGILFALSFCPTSAALFFGSAIPLAFSLESSTLIPLSYGVATGLPVLILSGLLSAGTGKAARFFDKVAAFQKWARTVTGILFILIGLYLSLVHIFCLGV